MGSMNRNKVIVGGLVAGIVIAVLDYVIFTYVLGPWAAGVPGAVSAAVAATMDSKRAMVGGVVQDILVGISVVWCYAAIRPRYGAGAKTGMCAGSFVWFIYWLSASAFYLFRLASAEFLCVAGVVYLVEVLIGAYFGCKMYSEDGTPA